MHILLIVSPHKAKRGNKLDLELVHLFWLWTLPGGLKEGWSKVVCVCICAYLLSQYKLWSELIAYCSPGILLFMVIMNGLERILYDLVEPTSTLTPKEAGVFRASFRGWCGYHVWASCLLPTGSKHDFQTVCQILEVRRGEITIMQYEEQGDQRQIWKTFCQKVAWSHLSGRFAFTPNSSFLSHCHFIFLKGEAVT